MPNLWMQCQGCSRVVYKPRVEEKLNVCPECNFHFEISSWKRIEITVDPGSFEEHFTQLSPEDPLGFRALKAYRDRLADAQRKTGLQDACVIGTALVEAMPVVFGVSDSRFLRGSMGSVVGEKICRGTELARDRGLPFIFVSGYGASGLDQGYAAAPVLAKPFQPATLARTIGEILALSTEKK